MNDVIAPSVRLRPEIAAMNAYAQGKQAAADAFKLSSNENPYPPHAAVAAAVAATIDTINRYPDGSAPQLRGLLGAKHGVPIGQIHVGAGSISILTQLVAAAAGPGDEVLYAWRSFEAYPGLATVAGATSVQVPNRGDHSHDIEALADSITERTRVLIVCSPNNPTGTIVTATEFASLMSRVPPDLLVLLDEAYYEFITDPESVDGVPLLARYPNLVVLRTFSKAFGLAGLRIGYAVGPEAVLDAARAASIALSVTAQAQAAAIASLEYERELLERVDAIVERRDRVWQALVDQGWPVPRPQGNFLWLPTGAASVEVATRFSDAGIVARALPPEGVRVSVGEEESVDKLLRSAEEIVRELPTSTFGPRLD